METNLCVIAGGGILPRKLADNFDPSGDRIFFLAFRNITDPEVVAGPRVPFMRIRISSRIASFAS